MPRNSQYSYEWPTQVSNVYGYGRFNKAIIQDRLLHVINVLTPAMGTRLLMSTTC